MDIHDLVTVVCNHAAESQRGIWDMYGFYMYADKRPGTPAERFDMDARRFAWYNGLFQRRKP